jgi:prepilin-type processing-associated H-X9-DG protein
MARAYRRGFTLKELLAATVFVGLVGGLALMGLQDPRGPHRKANCLNNLRQISMAGIAFTTTNQYLPTSRSWTSKSLEEHNTLPAELRGSPEEFAYTWVQPMLSYLDRIDLAATLDSVPEAAQASYGLRVPLLICTTDTHDGEGPAALDYAINAGRANCDSVFQNHDWKANGASYDALRQQRDIIDYRRSRLTRADLTDGASNTIAFAENIYLRSWCLDRTGNPPVKAITEFHSGVIWDPNVSSFPAVPAFDDSANKRGGVNLGAIYAHPTSRHSRGFNLAMWDGSARFVSNAIDYTVYARLMSSDGRRTQDPCVADFEGPTPAWQAKTLSVSDY